MAALAARFRTIDDILKNWKRYKPKPPRIKGFAFLLYTTREPNYSSFVQQNIRWLDSLTGKDFILFLFEQLDSYVSRFLHEIPKPEGGDTPVTPDVSFDVAWKFKVPLEELPCIVFFKDIKEKEFLVYPLNKDWTDDELEDAFKGVTADFQKAQEKAIDVFQKDESKWDHAMKVFWEELGDLLRARENRVRLIALGKTVFKILKEAVKLLKDAKSLIPTKD
ncbi:MAG: hypothetical protein ACFFCX_14245 [Candidatus Sifarchaeia archaeon]